MNDDLLHRYTKQHAGLKPAKPDSTADESEAEPIDHHGVYGVLRGVRDRALMLELRQKNGNITALGYAWLTRIDFDPSEGLTLHFAGHPIHLTGHRLHTLIPLLTRHRMVWIQEADEATLLQTADGECVVERILL